MSLSLSRQCNPGARLRAGPFMTLPGCTVTGAALRSLYSVALSSAPVSLFYHHCQFRDSPVQDGVELCDQRQARFQGQVRRAQLRQ